MTKFSLDWPKLSSAPYSQSMAEMATTGITEPAAGNIPGSAIRIEALQETLRHPSGTQGLIPLDRYIRNYDSAYHIIFTNVKTNSQIPLQTGGEPATACYSADIRDVFAAA